MSEYKGFFMGAQNLHFLKADKNQLSTLQGQIAHKRQH